MPECLSHVLNPPAVEELSKAILKTLGPLWSDEKTIEPFFVAAVVEELCDYLSPKLLQKARDQSVEIFEYAVLLSSWAVFIALHMGHCELGYLNRLRYRVFSEAAGLLEVTADVACETEEIVFMARATLPDRHVRVLGASELANFAKRASRKIGSRIDRLDALSVFSDEETPSIYGARGFRDG